MYRAYYKQVLARTFQETIGFAKRRVVFAFSIGLGMAIALAIFGATHLTATALLTNLKVIVSVYAVVVVLWFLWNFFVAAPAFLDNQLKTKLAAMETTENERVNKVADRRKLGLLMEEGQNLYKEVGNVRGEDFQAWDALLTGWDGFVRIALEEIGFPADYQEFMRAIDEAEPLGGVIKNLAWKQENRRRRLQKQQQKLAEIQRRLP
jgi:hypothetical protein